MLSAPTASAASPWDTAIKTTSSLAIGDNSSDYSKTYVEYMRDNCGFYYNLFVSALSDPNGKWAIVQQHVTSTINVVTVEWTTNPSADTAFLTDNPSPGSYSIGLTNTNYHVDLWNTPGFSKCYTGMGTSSLLGTTQTGPGWDLKVFLSTYPVTYPSGYEGEAIPDTLVDVDGDGLNAIQEQVQGTSDDLKDSDGDGLSDYTESIWNTNRDSEFCNTATTPYTCAYPNPTVKDLYVEIDWMKDSNNREFKPNTTQLSAVTSALNNHGITAHFDTGQYGGGNVLPSYTSDLLFGRDTGPDFYDYKNGGDSIVANFDSAHRSRIWHYMISGYQFHGDDPHKNTRSGGTLVGDDDSFVATGYIQDNQSGFGYTNTNTAIAGTILHELGHSMCLSDSSAYSFQSPSCVYDGIDDDNNSHNLYESSMNYDKQMFMVDYSDGSNLPGDDHNDWSAILANMHDFANTDRNAGDSLSPGVGSAKIIAGISSETAQKKKKEGTLGVGIPTDSNSSHESQSTAPTITNAKQNNQSIQSAKTKHPETGTDNTDIITTATIAGVTALAGGLLALRAFHKKH